MKFTQGLSKNSNSFQMNPTCVEGDFQCHEPLESHLLDETVTFTRSSLLDF